jgi:hypothetical protein
MSNGNYSEVCERALKTDIWAVSNDVCYIDAKILHVVRKLIRDSPGWLVGWLAG